MMIEPSICVQSATSIIERAENKIDINKINLAGRNFLLFKKIKNPKNKDTITAVKCE
jgi:hypothetical protein